MKRKPDFLMRDGYLPFPRADFAKLEKSVRRRKKSISLYWETFKDGTFIEFAIDDKTNEPFYLTINTNRYKLKKI